METKKPITICLFFCKKTYNAPVRPFVPVNDGFKTEPITYGNGPIGQIKLVCLNPNAVFKEQYDVSYTQLRRLERRPSSFEDACALTSAEHNSDEKMWTSGKKFLEK